MSWLFEWDDLLCVCGHKCASHSSYIESEFVGIGHGACGWNDWNGKTFPDAVYTPCGCKRLVLQDIEYGFLLALRGLCNVVLSESRNR